MPLDDCVVYIIGCSQWNDKEARSAVRNNVATVKFRTMIARVAFVWLAD